MSDFVDQLARSVSEMTADEQNELVLRQVYEDLIDKGAPLEALLERTRHLIRQRSSRDPKANAANVALYQTGERILRDWIEARDEHAPRWPRLR